MSFASAISGFLSSSVKQVLEQLMLSVDALWQDNRLPTKQAVGVTQRLLRLSNRIEALLARFRAGKVKWRRRAPAAAKCAEPVVPLDAAEAAAAADAAMLGVNTGESERAGRGRRPVYGLPPFYGWLGARMPNVAVTFGSALEAAFQTDEMRALMLATPEVARMAGPVFRMLGLEEQVLLVPEGYTGPAASNNRRLYAPDTQNADGIADRQQSLILPDDYDEERDGRKPHPLRDPSWNYPAFVNYRSYLYYYMNRKSAPPQYA